MSILEYSFAYQENLIKSSFPLPRFHQNFFFLLKKKKRKSELQCGGAVKSNNKSEGEREKRNMQKASLGGYMLLLNFSCSCQS